MEFIAGIIVFGALFGYWYVIIAFVVNTCTRSKKKTSRKRRKRTYTIDDAVNEFGEGIISYKER